jgi:hypothetical protein
MIAHQPDADTKALGRLARFAIEGQASEQDLLALMVLFHTHRLTFARPVMPSRPNVKELEALTQRGVAEVVSCAFPQHLPSELWSLYNSAAYRGRLEVMDDVPTELVERVIVHRAKLLAHPDVISIQPEN